MDDMLVFFASILDFLTDIFDLYTSTFILSGVLALWLVRKAVKVFRYL